MAETMDPTLQTELVAMLSRDHARMRAAGIALAEAALRVIRDHDGLHRLALAVAEWSTAIADEGDRPFVPCDRRIPGLKHAEGIAEHWHQRFLCLRSEVPADAAARHSALLFRSEGAKHVFDDIVAERKRISAPSHAVQP